MQRSNLFRATAWAIGTTAVVLVFVLPVGSQADDTVKVAQNPTLSVNDIALSLRLLGNGEANPRVPKDKPVTLELIVVNPLGKSAETNVLVELFSTEAPSPMSRTPFTLKSIFQKQQKVVLTGAPTQSLTIDVPTAMQAGKVIRGSLRVNDKSIMALNFTVDGGAVALAR